MLEQSTLWFGSWEILSRSPSQQVWHRQIRTEPLGPFLGWQHVHLFPNGRWWWPLGRSVRFEVFETEDASLLFVLERSVGLFTSWRLTEADELDVGEVISPSLMDNNGERRAFLDCPSANEGRVLDPSMAILADFYAESNDLRVNLFETLGDNPFLKMLVLAGVLAIQPLPG